MSSMSLKAQDAILLRKNDIAPYSGILAPQDYMRDLEGRAEKADFYKLEISKAKDCLPVLSEFDPVVTNSTAFWIGTGIGFILASTVFITFKN